MDLLVGLLVAAWRAAEWAAELLSDVVRVDGARFGVGELTIEGRLTLEGEPVVIVQGERSQIVGLWFLLARWSLAGRAGTGG
jgi:hypothetical protein